MLVGFYASVQPTFPTRGEDLRCTFLHWICLIPVLTVDPTTLQSHGVLDPCHTQVSNKI